jgi:hypothetical protein
MRDSQYGVPIERCGDELSTLARTVVARLAARGGRALQQIDPDLVFAMARAVASVDPALYDALRPEIRRARISDIDLVDSYFPAVARLLGCDWAEDRAGWAEVTIGLARLQSLVHQIGLGWDGSTAVDGASVLIVLPEGEQHSFGAQVLAGQLRRQGISVHLQIGTRLAVLRTLVQERQYDCAMVSVGCETKLELGRKIVMNVIVVGYFAAVSGILEKKAFLDSVTASVPEKALALNLRAFEAGYNFGRSAPAEAVEPVADAVER